MKPLSGLWIDLQLNRLLQRFGCRLQWAPDWDAVFAGCDLFIDVGAHLGETVDRFRAQGYRGRFECFDANRDMVDGLAGRRGVTAHCAALSDIPGTRAFHIRREHGRSSLLESEQPDHHGYDVISSHVVFTHRLDSYKFAARNIFLKVDTEGNDLNVLRGAAGLLPQVSHILMEVAPVPRYVGEPPMEQVIGHLRERGFVVAFFERNLFPALDARRDCEAFDVVFKKI